jgi:flagellar biosynthesis/type III secretory pathway protein FliH
MSFIALHRADHTGLATDRDWLGSEDWSHCESAHELLQRLEHLAQTRERELARAQEQARAEGHALGLQQGREEALKIESQRLWQAWDAAAGAAQQDMQALREALVSLSLQVVQHITEQLAPADVVAALARRASEQLLPPRAAVVRVHPQLADAVRERLSGSSAGAQLEVRADARLRWQDCEFDTPAGQLLAGVQAQLGRVNKALQGTALQGHAR